MNPRAPVTLQPNRDAHRAEALFARVGTLQPRLGAWRRRPPRRGRRILAALAIVAVVSLVSVPVALAWLQGEQGHAWIARELEENISSQIRGHIVVGHLDEIDLHHVVGRDIRFFDEGGRVVLEADQVDMQYELSELLSGHFVSHASVVHGGRVLLETNAAGVLLVNRAFQSAHPGPPGQPVGPDVVHLDHLDAHDVTLVAALGSAPVATLSGVGAMVLVRAPDRGAAIVQAQHVHGHLHVQAPIPWDMRVIAASFAVDGAAHRRAHIDLPTRMGDQQIGIEITATTLPDQSLHVDARIRPHGLGAMLAATGMIAQCLIAETASEALDVTVELQL